MKPLFAIFLLLLALLAGCNQPAPLPVPPRDGTMLTEFNRDRALVGAPPLTSDDCLNRTAQDWAEKEEQRGRIGHDGYDARMAHCHVLDGGEVVAYGRSDAAGTNTDWMNSPEHKFIINSKHYTHCGTGQSGVYYAAMFSAPAIRASAKPRYRIPAVADPREVKR
jgi:hypothetical protein